MLEQVDQSSSFFQAPLIVSVDDSASRIKSNKSNQGVISNSGYAERFPQISQTSQKMTRISTGTVNCEFW